MTQPVRQRQIRGRRAGIQAFEQMFDGAYSHVLGRLHHRRKARRHAVADLDAVESGDRDIVRHLESLRGESPNGGDCEHVGGAEERGGSGVA